MFEYNFKKQLPQHTHYCQISLKTMHGYDHSRFPFNYGENDDFFAENEMFSKMYVVSTMEVVEALIQIKTKVPRKHDNLWSFGYDEYKSSNETIWWLSKILFDIDIDQFDFAADGIFPTKKAYTIKMYEKLSMSLLGFHVYDFDNIIVKRLTTPSDILYHDRVFHPTWKNNQLLMKKATIGVMADWDSENELVMYDTSVVPFMLLETKNEAFEWIETKFTSMEQLETAGFKVVIKGESYVDE